MAFANKIKGIDQLGVVASVVGNERTVAARMELHRNMLSVVSKNGFKPSGPKMMSAPKDAWHEELKRLGFEA